MRHLLAGLLMVALPVWAVEPASCGALCGSWKLDTTASPAVAPIVDAALLAYSDPRAKRIPRSQRNIEGLPRNTADDIGAANEHALGPILDRPVRGDLRTELIALLAPPTLLNLNARGPDLVIQGDQQVSRKISPGTPRARVDANGTAKILATWKHDRLRISEKYDGRRQYSETYTLQAADGALLVTREVQRPGLKPLRLQAVYRRS